MRKRRYTIELLSEAIKLSSSFAGVIRYLGFRQAGGTQSHIKRMAQKFNIDFSHFTGMAHGRGKRSLNRKTAKEILVLNSALERRMDHKKLYRSLIEIGRNYICELCGCDGQWNGMKLTLDIDHKDGDYKNNTSDNLRFLCPNCHTQTSTFGSKNKARKVNY